MSTMNSFTDQFVRNARSWGVDGDSWLKDIPRLIAHAEDKWLIKVQEPFALNYNFVAPAICEDGRLVVVKIGFPGDREFKTELETLKTFDGKSCVKLLEADDKSCIALLERVVPGVPLSSIVDDAEATRMAASVIKKLATPIPANHNFPTVNEWSKEITEYKAKYGVGGPLPLELVEKSEITFADLIDSSEKPVLVHGDLHQDNILYSKENGWIAIDPKGIAAEPAFEVAAMIRNPYDKLKEIKNLEPFIAKRIMILSEELGFQPKRILKWCFAYTMLSAVWSVDGTKGYEHALRVAVALNNVEV